MVRPPRHTATVVSALVLVLAAALAVRADRRSRYLRAELAAADDEIAAARFAVARTRLSRLAASWPDDPPLLLRLGRTEAARGRNAAALAAWERIPRTAAEFRDIAIHRADLAQRMGRLSLAEADLRAAINADEPLSSLGRDRLVRLLRLEGRTAEARELYLRGFPRETSRAAALRGLYRLDVDSYPSQGVARFLASVSEVSDPGLELTRADSDLRAGRPEAAAGRLDALLKENPEYRPALMARIRAAVAMRDISTLRSLAGRLIVVDIGHEERLAVEDDVVSAFAEPRAEREHLASRSLRRPGRVRDYERLAVLETDPEKTRALRSRRAGLEAARSEYETRLASWDLTGQAEDLSRLAAVLGRTFDAEAWALIAEGTTSPAVWQALVDRALPPAGPPNASLAERLDTLVDLDKQVPLAGDPPQPVVPRFRDVAVGAGLAFVQENGDVTGRLIPPVTASGGVGLLDFDGDGRLDVYFVQAGAFPPDRSRTVGDRLYRNRGDGTFEDVTASSGIGALVRGYGHGIAVGDVDGDGRPDIFLTRWRSYTLLRNRGDGTFEDRTDALGLAGDRDWPTSSAFGDFDGDGDLDLYVCHYLAWDENDSRSCVVTPSGTTGNTTAAPQYRCNPRDFPARADHLFRNDGVRFTDVTIDAGIRDTEGRGLGVIAADLDDDGRLDIFVANDTTANYYFRNLGGMRFEERAHESGLAANADGGYQAGMGVARGDLDGDGRLDVLVTNYYDESTTFFRNLGDGNYADSGAPTGLKTLTRPLLGFGVALLDANADGRLDLLSANGHVHDGRPQFPWMMPAQLLIQDSAGRFRDPGTRAGEAFGVERLGRALAVGDLDGDGREDALLVGQNAPAAYLRNEGPAGRSIAFRLQGTASGRDAVGARVTIRVGGRTLTAERFGGGSYQSAGDRSVRFGLGDAEAVDEATIRWPSGHVDHVGRLPAGAMYLVREGDTRLPTPRPFAETPK